MSVITLGSWSSLDTFGWNGDTVPMVVTYPTDITWNIRLLANHQPQEAGKSKAAHRAKPRFGRVANSALARTAQGNSPPYQRYVFKEESRNSESKKSTGMAFEIMDEVSLVQ